MVARGNLFDSPHHAGATASDEDLQRGQTNGHAKRPDSQSSPLQSRLPLESANDRVNGEGDKSALPPVPKARSEEVYGSRSNLQNGTDGLKFGTAHVVASVSRLEPLESGEIPRCFEFSCFAI